MTNEEAIDILNTMYGTNKEREAIEVAIEALKDKGYEQGYKDGVKDGINAME